MDTRSQKGQSLYIAASRFLDQCEHSEWDLWSVFDGTGEWNSQNHVTEFSDCFCKAGKNDADLLAPNYSYG